MDTETPDPDAPARPGPEAGGGDVRVEVVDPELGAPPVVAVVVCHDPGDWFEAALAGLAAQDYPSLSVLVVDTDSTVDPTPRVAAVLPDAYVRRLSENPGFGVAANEVLTIVEGASFYLFCHDDVALAPDAVRALVEEAYRSNGGIVGPKLVSWEDPTRLLQVGMVIDKSGHDVSPVERGELDQEQHDAVQDVFSIPGAATLVRADLFAGLGGYDPAITFLGEDLDLCWRAQVAGARVLVAPQAVARHVEALGHRAGFGPEERRRLGLRHRLRAVLTCYGRFHRLRVLPQVALLAFAELVYALVAGRRRLAADIVAAWRWNWAHRRENKAARRRLDALRAVPDSEVRRLQARGSARFAAFVRGQLGRTGDDRVRALSRSSRDLAGTLRASARSTTVVVWGVLVAILLLGSRHYIFGTPPSLVDLPPLPTRPWPLLAEWLSGWRRAGLGSEAMQPTAYGLLGVFGTVLAGSTALLTRLLVLVPLFAGPIGAARLLRPTGSARASVAAGVVYAAIPLPYDALANGSWGGVVAWSAMPWLVSALARAGGDAPFDRPVPRARWRDVVVLGLLTALVSAVVPVAVLAPVVLAVALVLGGVVVGRTAGALRTLSTALAASAVAFVLHLPWSIEAILPDGVWAAFAGPESSVPAPTVDELMRFDVGPIGASPVAWAFPLAALVPLLIGRAWRLTWAVRAWALAVVGWGLAVAAGADAFPVTSGPIELLLAPAACGLALAVGLGVVAFEADVPGHRFGWRQVVGFGAAAAVVAGCVPVLVGSAGGRWDAPARGVGDVLGFLDAEQETEGAFRTLWLGDPSVLPLGGWDYEPGVAWATTDAGLPTVIDRWPGSPDGTTRLVTDALDLAVDDQTSRLGRLLAPMGVRYIVIVEADRPVVGPEVPVPDTLPAALGRQLDLAQVEVDPGLIVFRNVAWFSSRAALASPEAASAAEGGLAPGPVDASDAPAVLVEADGATRYEGPLPGDSTIWWSASSASGWGLSAGGEEAGHGEGFGWGNLYSVDAGGDATLSYGTPLTRLLASGAQAAVWVLALRALLAARRRDRPVGLR